MNAAASLLLPFHNLETDIRAANNSNSNPTRECAIRDANSASGSLHSTGHTSVNDADRCIRDFDDGLRAEHVGAGPIRVAASTLTACNRDFSLDGDGIVAFVKQFAHPHDYLASLPPALRDEVMQYHVDQRHHINIKRRRSADTTTIISRDGRFLAFGRSDLQSLTGSEVFTAVLEAIGEPRAMLSVWGLSFADESVVVEIVSQQVATEIRPGDVIRGGLRVVHSRVGADATLIHSFALRLLCTNGLVHRECTGSRRVRRTRRLPAGSKQAKDRQLEQIHRLSRQNWSHTRRLLDSVQHLHKEPVTDLRTVFERYLRNGRLFSRNLVERLLKAWEVEGSETNAYGVLNALSRVATHDSELSARQRRALAALAGIFAQKNTHICPHCFSVVSAVN